MNGWRRAAPAACCAALITALLLLAGCRPGGLPDSGERVELLVSAAVSLQDSMDRIVEAFERENPGIRVTMNYGASGTLRRQIGQGAPADLFISADTAQMEALIGGGLIGDHAVLLGNLLTVVVPANRVRVPGTLGDLAAGEYRVIALGDPGTVPAGGYAAEALRHDGLWDRLEPKIIYGKDVRQVLAWVESGNADAGVVYRTDALRSNAVRAAFDLPEDLHAPVRYPAGVVKGTKHPDEAARFFAFLTGETAKRIFETNGFVFLYPAGHPAS